jgi:hypothetical protein
MERRLELANPERTDRYEPERLRQPEKTPRLSLWEKMFIVLMLGAIIGVAGAKNYYERRLEEAIKLQRFVHKAVIYEIREAKSAFGQ